MLLLLKATSATLTATIAGIGAVVASGSTVSATIAGVGTLIPPESIELMVSASIAGSGNVTAISAGFVTRTATVDGIGTVSAFGGYGATLSFAGVGGITATVGSFFDGGAVSLTGVGAVSAAGRHLIPALLIPGIGGMSAVPIISGGTISSAALVSGSGALTVSVPVMTALANVTGQGSLSATGRIIIPNLATDMRLSFESDEIRVFFRKG